MADYFLSLTTMLIESWVAGMPIDSDAFAGLLGELSREENQ